jgi:hypothetical protein
MRRAINFAIALLLLALPACAQAAPLHVEAVNASKPTRCAEADNIYVRLISPRVQRFTIEARHPAYLSAMTADDKAPDFGNCRTSRDPAFRSTPREVTLYEDARWQLRGFTYSTFWRRAQVPVRVGTRVETGLHLLQLWTRGRERDEEVLVLYPADGYWRVRPLAPEKLGWQPDLLLPTAYGASFLVGPVEQQRRPLVDIRDVTFDPGEGAFHLKFARGGGATVKVAALNGEKISLDIALTRSMPLMPFAALRSMFVAPDNADTAEVSWQDTRDVSHAPMPVMKFKRANVSELWAGRSRPSRHNTSAPDMVFAGFKD